MIDHTRGQRWAHCVFKQYEVRCTERCTLLIEFLRRPSGKTIKTLFSYKH